VALEQPLGGFEDMPAGLGRLLAAAGGVVATGALDTFSDLDTLAITSIQSKGNELP
jgi:hypothetical protein